MSTICGTSAMTGARWRHYAVKFRL